MNKEPVMISTGIDAILAGPNVQSRHILLLYTSYIDKYAIQTSFFAACETNEKPVYITYEEPGFIIRKFEDICLKPIVIHPERIHDLKNMGNRMRIINDGISGYEGLEKSLAGNNNIVLCMYDLAGLESKSLQDLVASHDKLILNTPDMTVLSTALFDKQKVTDATIERFVKDYLDILILASIAHKPMCGTDIIDMVHRDFKVLLSPGTVYPLLHKLKNEGLLECEYRIKKKVYKPAEGNKANIRSILDEHMLANEFINGFLKSKGSEVTQYE